MTFLPKGYAIPKRTEEENINSLIGMANKGKLWALSKLVYYYGLDCDYSSNDVGESPQRV